MALAGLAGVEWLRAAAPDSLEVREDLAVRAAVNRVAPAVVRIETIGAADRIGSVLAALGSTTGLVVSPDGYIITSTFNFAHKPASIIVTLPDGARLAATQTAADHSRQLVLLKVKTDHPLAVAEAAPVKDVQVGQWAVAVGRTFETGRPNLSVGIVSAVGRIWGKALQTDAKISPANYGGPLVDIRGRVLGLLAPLSPDGDTAAGVEWYDSGIGFAVPLEHVLSVLPKLSAGEDLHPGLMGVSFREADFYADPPQIAACLPKSPAYQAGFKPGDRVVEVDGQPVASQAELKHQISHRYSGDMIHVVVMRGKERIGRDLELVAKLAPYQHPFLGVLPMRWAAGETGIVVRYVYPQGPADKAGIKPFDRLVQLEGIPIKSHEALLEQIANLSPDQKVAVLVGRDQQTLPLTVQLSTLPEAIPADRLPPPHEPVARAAGDKTPVGKVSVRVPEIPNACLAYVPETYTPQTPHGLIVWLHPPGGYKDQELIDRFKQICEQNDLILLAPKANDPTRWQRTEGEAIRKLMDDVIARYNIDRSRVVIAGQEGGGSLAYLLAFAYRDLVRGVLAVEAGLPSGVKPPANDPVNRLAIVSAASQKTTLLSSLGALIKVLRSQKYPVVTIELGDTPRGLSAGEWSDIARWIDSLDRM